MRSALSCGLAMALGLVAGLADAAGAPNVFQPTRELIRDRMIDETVPSIAVAVTRGGRILWEEGFGWADKERRLHATPHTPYSLASVTKPLTATALMILTERGAIDLDHPMNDYLGAARIVARVGDARDATVRRVANHTSGLPEHWRYFYEDEPLRRPSMDELIASHAQLVSAPGEAFVYANLGYALIEYAIELRSGRPFADFMREEVFLPLGMKHTFVRVSAKAPEPVAVRYARNREPIPFYDEDTRGAGAAYASAHDLALFGMFSLKDHLPTQQAILGDATLDSMHPPDADRGDTYRYGIGWESRPRAAYEGLLGIAHRGDMSGVSTRLTLLPEHDIAIVVLSNCENKINRLIEQSIVHALLPQTRRFGSQFKPDGALVGRWAGAVEVEGQRIPVALDVSADGRTAIQIDGAVGIEIDQPTWAGGVLGLSGVQATLRNLRMARPYRLNFSLRPHGDSLDGAVLAEERSVVGRDGSGISFWTHLERAPVQSH